MNYTIDPTTQANLPPGYPYEWIGSVTLRDGTLVTIRPIRPDDAPRLQEGFTRLSARTIYLRFLQATSQLSDEQAKRFANLDYQTQMALVGSIQEQGEEQLIGVARYALVGSGDQEAAECAVVVRDDYQQRGLGTHLLVKLVQYARQQGILAFIATVLASNSPVMNFIWKSGLHYDRKMVEPGVFQIRILLEDIDDTHT